MSAIIFFTLPQASKEKSSLWSNTGLDISLDTLSPISTKDKPIQPSMNQMSNQQLSMSSQMLMQPQQSQPMPSMASPSSMYGMPTTSTAQLSTGMNNMGLGTVRPMQTTNQPMQQMGMQQMGMQQMGMQQMGMQQMHAQAVGRPQQMSANSSIPSMGMPSNQGILNYQGSGMQSGFQQPGLRMPMQSQMYQSSTQGTMGQFRS